MNLLNDSGNISRQYVAEMISKNTLENINTVTTKVEKKKRISISKKFLSFFIFGVILAAAPITLMLSGSSVVNADKLSTSDFASSTSVDSTVLFSSPLTPRVKKSAVPGYVKGDKRVLALKKYLEQKGSPLASIADVIVSEADKNGLDYRLLVGISGVESGFCKVTTIRMDGTDSESYNCWGWGKNGNRFSEFSSWKEAVVVISRGIAKGYGPTPTPESMQDMYCTSCRGDNRWISGVKENMSDISAIEKKLY